MHASDVCSSVIVACSDGEKLGTSKSQSPKPSQRRNKASFTTCIMQYNTMLSFTADRFILFIFLLCRVGRLVLHTIYARVWAANRVIEVEDSYSSIPAFLPR
jgi:hypothetical protein